MLLEIRINGKAPREDEIPVDISKPGGVELDDLLKRIFNRAWRSE